MHLTRSKRLGLMRWEGNTGKIILSFRVPDKVL